MAHQCVLNGSSAADITSYNSCKNDLLMGLSGHDSTATAQTDLADRVAELEAENQRLSATLDRLRGRLLDLAKEL